MIDDETGRPATDAHQLIGARVLVGITYFEAERSVQTQRHGVVIRCDEEVIEIECPDGEVFTLPPAPEAFSPAPPGEYRLRSTGETVVDPDFLATWTVDYGDDEAE
ncbi:hypothetical protein [Mycobacterium sp. DL99]|uniref:hypothetical protein n=1 Tax=Mycobacterium sp. DL99 TaxID=2528957 RepID=UPI001081F815|nr:hypothetical protein [Mycobacterium sp. DL99]